MLNKVFEYIKENWYFIRQDIVSYSISTILYVIICFIKYASINEVVYGIFDCLVYYISFWFIRISFDATYHSNNWKHCKFWTRTMLCSGVFVLALMPIRYSLFNGIFVALICCIILYLVQIEVLEKRKYKKGYKDIYNMNEGDLRNYAKSKGISEMIVDTLVLKVIHNYRWCEIRQERNYSRHAIDYHRNIINKKLNIEL